jgi:hypothetical protein
MTPQEHADALAASLTAAMSTIQDWLGDAFLDDTWKSALTEYQWGQEALQAEEANE